MAQKKKIMRRKPAKKGGVSKKVKQYVKRLTKTPNRPYEQDSTVYEKVVTTGQMFFMDDMFRNNTFFTDNVLRAQSSGLKLKYLVYNNSATTGVCIRFLVLETLRGGDYSNYKQTSPSANISTQSDELFEQGGSGSNMDIDVAFTTNSSASNILLRINRDNYKVHRDFTLNLGTSSADRANFAQGTVWIPFKRLITYDNIATGSNTDPVNTKLIVLGIPVEVPQDPATPPTQQVEISAVATWYFRA